MHLRVPVETQEVRKVDLNRPVFYVISEWNGTFAKRPDFWFTFPYRPNSESILKRFAGFVSVPLLCVSATSLPTGLLERTGAYQYKIVTMAVWKVPTV